MWAHFNNKRVEIGHQVRNGPLTTATLATVLVESNNAWMKLVAQSKTTRSCGFCEISRAHRLRDIIVLRIPNAKHDHCIVGVRLNDICHFGLECSIHQESFECRHRLKIEKTYFSYAMQTTQKYLRGHIVPTWIPFEQFVQINLGTIAVIDVKDLIVQLVVVRDDPGAIHEIAIHGAHETVDRWRRMQRLIASAHLVSIHFVMQLLNAHGGAAQATWYECIKSFHVDDKGGGYADRVADARQTNFRNGRLFFDFCNGRVSMRLVSVFFVAA